jgi:hypothetical protein
MNENERLAERLSLISSALRHNGKAPATVNGGGLPAEVASAAAFLRQSEGVGKYSSSSSL